MHDAPFFVWIPAYAGTTILLSRVEFKPCRFFRDGVIPTFVAPAKAGVQAYARRARRVFAWIPAYAGTTRYLSLATFKAHGFPR